MSVTPPRGSDPAIPRRGALRAGFLFELGKHRTVRFTPPCYSCFYPMLKGETSCLRCGKARP